MTLESRVLLPIVSGVALGVVPEPRNQYGGYCFSQPVIGVASFGLYVSVGLRRS